MAVPAQGADEIFWANSAENNFTPPANQIWYADLSDGSHAANMGPELPSGDTVNRPVGIAVDARADKIYWSNRGSNQIMFADLDGTDGGVLDTRGATVNAPDGLAIDPPAGKIYWANENAGISWAWLNGDGGGNLNTGAAPVNNPDGVAIDTAKDRIYWANEQGSSIAWASLSNDGEGGKLADTARNPNAVAINQVADKIYWNSGREGTSITFMTLNPPGAVIGHLEVPTGDPRAGLAIDPAAHKIYFSSFVEQSLGYANLDEEGAFVEGPPVDLDDLPGEVHQPEYIALLERPFAVGKPTVEGGDAIGSILSCSQGEWATDELGGFLYREPAGFSYRWTLDGATIPDADSEEVTASKPGEYVCHVTAHNHAGDSAEVEASIAHTVKPEPPGPALRLVNTASTEAVHPGGQVTYTLVVTNRGPGKATGVELDDLAPLRLSFTGAESSQGSCTTDPERLHCMLGSLPDGEAQVRLTADVDVDARLGPLVNTATVWHDREPGEGSIDSAESTVDVTAVPQSGGGGGGGHGGGSGGEKGGGVSSEGPGAQPSSDLTVTKHVDAQKAVRGQRLRYTITVTNNGPNTARGVRLTDTPKLPMRIVKVQPGQGSCQTGPPLTCTLGAVRSGAHVTVTVTAVATVAGAQINTATVMSENRDRDPTNSIAAARTRILRRRTVSPRGHPPSPKPPPPLVTG